MTTLAVPSKPEQLTDVQRVSGAWRFRLWDRLVNRGRYPWRGPHILSDEIVRWWLRDHRAEELIQIPPDVDDMLSALADAVMANVPETPDGQLVPDADLELMRAHFARLKVRQAQ